jgi:hypothetical protein
MWFEYPELQFLLLIACICSLYLVWNARPVCPMYLSWQSRLDIPIFGRHVTIEYILKDGPIETSASL